MLPFRLVFLMFGISMIFSSAVICGESPNDRIDTLLSLMTGMSERLDKLQSDVEEVKKSAGCTFIGNGYDSIADEYYNGGINVTIARCFSICADKRSEDSRWNGVLFKPFKGGCTCLKNDRGHHESKYEEIMHFKC